MDLLWLKTWRRCLDLGFETLNLKVCELQLWELTVVSNEAVQCPRVWGLSRKRLPIWSCVSLELWPLQTLSLTSVWTPFLGTPFPSQWSTRCYILYPEVYCVQTTRPYTNKSAELFVNSLVWTWCLGKSFTKAKLLNCLSVNLFVWNPVSKR